MKKLKEETNCAAMKCIRNIFKLKFNKQKFIIVSSKDDYDKDNDEEHVMHSESDSIEIMVNDEADEVKGELFNHSLMDIKIIWKNC